MFDVCVFSHAATKTHDKATKTEKILVIFLPLLNNRIRNGMSCLVIVKFHCETATAYKNQWWAVNGDCLEGVNATIP
jgi:hypothetical protein